MRPLPAPSFTAGFALALVRARLDGELTYDQFLARVDELGRMEFQLRGGSSDDIVGTFLISMDACMDDCDPDFPPETNVADMLLGWLELLERGSSWWDAEIEAGRWPIDGSPYPKPGAPRSRR